MRFEIVTGTVFQPLRYEMVQAYQPVGRCAHARAIAEKNLDQRFPKLLRRE